MKKLLTNFSFKQQLLLIFSVGITLLAITTSLVISSISAQVVRTQIIEQGLGITNAFSKKSTLALLYQSTASARDSAKSTLSFPDVIGVSIFDESTKILFKEGDINIQDYSQLTLSKNNNTETTEYENSWVFTAPVYAGTDYSADEESPFSEDVPDEALVGYVAVSMTKSTLTAMTHEILMSNILTSIGLSSILLCILLGVSNRLTKPLSSLATIMRRAEKGETNIRADFDGPSDIQNMETAFNTMIQVIESREQELVRARDSALITARTKGEFAANVSHELRTPMNGIMGMLQLLDTMELTQQQEEYINVAQDSSQALLNLIDDILDFSKVESGKLKLRPSNFSPRELAKDIVDLLSIQANKKSVSLCTDIHPETPNTLYGDTERIRQILINLVGNALKFTDNGSVTIKVSVDQKIENSPIRFDIVDTGIGIPDSDLKMIFQAFAQVDGSSTRRHGGTGLGLAITQQLVELMAGAIGVESKEGVGSTFWFEIPLEAENKDVEKKKKSIHNLADLSVLLACNDAKNCHTLANFFINGESNLRRVSEGKKILQLIDQAKQNNNSYDLLIVGETMPDMSGIELIEYVSNIDKKIQTIYLSDRDSKERIKFKNRKIICLPYTQDMSPFQDAIQELFFQALPPSNKIESAIEHSMKAGKILVVEDNRANQHVAIAMLDRLGIKGHIADDGNAAIDRLDEETFDLVLMDCNMPGMDGYEATKRIRAKESTHQQIIIAMTAETGPEAKSKCIDSGMDDYLSKPMTLANLNNKLSKWLPKEKLFQENTIQIHQPISTKTNNHCNDDSTLDFDIFDELTTQICGSLPAMIKAFLEDTPEYIQQLVPAIEEKKYGKIRSLSHYIQGSASNLGANKLANLCKKLETHSKSNQISNYEDTFNKVEIEFSHLKLILQKKLSLLDLIPFSERNKPEHNATQQNILIVDDDKSARFSLHGILERSGYNITEATNGLEALNRCLSFMPDLILMDAMMPEMDGFTACQKILEIESPRKPHILIVTALNQESSIEKAFSAGASDFIPKPVNLMVLRKRVERLLISQAIEKTNQKLAHFDDLTNLPNRTNFLERAQGTLDTAKENQDMFALLFLDLDRFKLVNDSQGHDAGDLLLKTISKRLHGCVRSDDLVARLGGDEFTIILENISTPEVAAIIAEKVCISLAQSFSFMDTHIFISTSIGIATYPKNGEDLLSLMKHADTAMFRAKSKGGNCYQYYEYGMETEITRKIELESELRQAIKNDELILHFQPQECLVTGNIIGLEALVRWQHPQRGLLPPGEFIPIAEESSLILLVGDWVLRKTCQQLATWKNQEQSKIPIAVNVASTQLESGQLFNIVSACLTEYKIPPRLLKLELTENTLVNTSETLIDQMHELKKLGVSLEIDDFGTGYSSLSYLKRFPVDTLKIDRSFIMDLSSDKDDLAIVTGIIALGHSLGLKIIAEGVETEEQKELLTERKCDVMQGYFLSRPLGSLELENWLSTMKVMR